MIKCQSGMFKIEKILPIHFFIGCIQAIWHSHKPVLLHNHLSVITAALYQGFVGTRYIYALPYALTMGIAQTRILKKK